MPDDILKHDLSSKSVRGQRTFALGTVCILYKTSYIVSHCKCNYTHNDSQLQAPWWRILYEQGLDFKVSIIYVQVHFIVCIRGMDGLYMMALSFLPVRLLFEFMVFQDRL